MADALKLYGPAVGNLAVTIGLYFHLKSQIKVAQTPPLEDIYARLDEIEKILKGIVPALQNHDKVIRAITTRPPPQNGEKGDGEKKGKATAKSKAKAKKKPVKEEEEEDLEEGVTEVEEDTRPKRAKKGKTKATSKAKTNTPKAKKLTKEEAEEIWVEGQAPDDDKIDDILGLNETTGADEEEEIELEYEITESEPPQPKAKAKAKAQSKSFRKAKSS